MFIAFSEGILSVTQYDEDMFLVRAKRLQTLEVVSDSIQLAGEAEEVQPFILSIAADPENDFPFSTRIPKPTFALFLTFELLNYLDYTDNTDIATLAHARALAEMKEANLL